jgi:SRSO17 transposase
VQSKAGATRTWVAVESKESHARDFEGRLTEYLNGFDPLLGDKRRRENFALYAAGILGESERKSVEPIAARASKTPKECEALHRQLLRFIADSPWEDRPIRKYAMRYAMDAMTKHGPIRHWIIDDTGFLKQGKLSPGVQRQYTGSAGKVANCQIAVSLTVATEHAHVPIDVDLYLPESWAEDRKRCVGAKIPDDVVYRPKWEIAADMIQSALASDVPVGTVLADAGYGTTTEFRARLEHLGINYAVGIQSTVQVKRVFGRGSTRRLGKRMSVKDLCETLKDTEFRTLTWREGTKGKMQGSFAILRVVASPTKHEQRAEQWLIIEKACTDEDDFKYTLSTEPPSSTRKKLIWTLKERWRTERVYEDLKGELGLDHFEGRSYRGWQHHVTLVLCCCAFLVAEQARGFSP